MLKPVNCNRITGFYLFKNPIFVKNQFIYARPHSGAMQKAQELDKSKNYFVYCRVGGRSKQACMILDSIGFENTFNLMGGFENWQGAKTQ